MKNEFLIINFTGDVCFQGKLFYTIKSAREFIEDVYADGEEYFQNYKIIRVSTLLKLVTPKQIKE